MSRRRPTVLVAALSARALAASAVRAGWACVAVDAFADLDLPGTRAPGPGGRAAGASVGGPSAGRTASSLAGAAADVAAGAVVYGAPFENHPAAVARLAAGRELWGTPPSGLRGARDPHRLGRTLREAGVAFPLTLPAALAGRADGRPWLRKPRRGGGGMGIAPWRPGEPLRRGELVQERAAGEPGSAVVAADGRWALVLGLTRQLLGRRAFGVSGFRWCGNLYPLEAEPEEARALLEASRRAASALAGAFGLRGLFGIDFVHRDGRLAVVEVNPRPTASMELLEERDGLSVFDAHARACRGHLPEPPEAGATAGRASGRGRRGVHGKAIVFATRDLIAGDTRAWSRLGARDLPCPGSRIPTGTPICTVLARGSDARECELALARRAARIYRIVERRPGERTRHGRGRVPAGGP